MNASSVHSSPHSLEQVSAAKITSSSPHNARSHSDSHSDSLRSRSGKNRKHWSTKQGKTDVVYFLGSSLNCSQPRKLSLATLLLRPRPSFPDLNLLLVMVAMLVVLRPFLRPSTSSSESLLPPRLSKCHHDRMSNREGIMDYSKIKKEDYSYESTVVCN